MEMPKDKILSQDKVRPFDRLMVLSEAEAQAHRSVLDSEVAQTREKTQCRRKA
jgi:hypothetical protein